MKLRYLYGLATVLFGGLMLFGASDAHESNEYISISDDIVLIQQYDIAPEFALETAAAITSSNLVASLPIFPADECQACACDARFACENHARGPPASDT